VGHFEHTTSFSVRVPTSAEHTKVPLARTLMQHSFATFEQGTRIREA
jgi:hypothetical protein